MIAVITNSFYKSYRASYAENKRVEEKNYVITQFENMIEDANQNAKELSIENDVSLTKWSVRLDNKIIFSYDQASSSMYNANGSLIKTFEKTAKINTARLPVNNRSIIRSSAEIMSIGFSFSLLNAVSSPTSKNSAKVFGYCKKPAILSDTVK